MKYFLQIFGSFILICSLSIFLHADPSVSEAPIESVESPSCISVSTSVWTQIPSSNSSGRLGLFINNPGSNSARIHGILSNSSTTPTTSTTTAVIELFPNDSTSFIGIDDGVYLWLVSNNGVSGAENVCVQEYKQ